MLLLVNSDQQGLQEVTDQRILLVLTCLSWNHFCSRRTVSTCHSVGTTRPREAGIDSSGRKKIAKVVKNPLGLSPRRSVNGTFSEDIEPFSQTNLC